LVVEQALNVIDGEVLFAGPDDVFADGIGFGGLLGAFGRRQKERPGRVLAEVVDQDAKSALGIAETLGGFFRGEFVDEKGA
jgi:hypothetical protein